MRPLVPMRTRVEYRRRDGPPSGTVVLRMLVDESGRVVRSAVLQSSGHAGLDESALHAAREARFAPHRVNGVATAVTVLTPMHFGQPSQSQGTEPAAP
ncbi:energy transducer TonB [Sphaerotilus sp.]|uniref:energy transducer TonB family protein n=1 Tax=Sphaerotilus sp. TaxID=2093942 RepID=UPI002ACD2C5A|nr:energy transducer TonB [Sphaerotilus sp.]MDZ7855836.1 energy transducer TonB [Sphaerotilus sp.]